jgi:uncharacterized protein YgbK (DUF1537 family)
MNRRLDIAIIADDLTGAADAGVQFCPYLGPIYMTGGEQSGLDSIDIQSRGVTVFTNTRNIPPASAADTVYRVAKVIKNLHPVVVYKKIDSCLRGNLGSELDALSSALHATASFVAPALPVQGRTTVNDCHLINGIPINETEIGRDPLSPVNESRLSVLLSTQSQMSIGHVHLSYLEKGIDALFEQVKKLLEKGSRHIVFDAKETNHLDDIASLARSRFENILLVGSAGLARSLAQVIAPGATSERPEDRPRLKKWLFVCGSASQVLAGQVDILAQSTGWSLMSIDPNVLTTDKTSTERTSLLSKLIASWHTGSLIMSIASSPDAGSIESPDRVVKELAHVVSSLLSSAAPDGLFLSGGDTAEKVMQKINGSAILLCEEILPGLMRGKIAGGPFQGLPVFTKPGAFGQPDTLIQLIDALPQGE